MDEENPWLDTFEPVEVQDGMKITHHFEWNLWNKSQIIEGKDKRSHSKYDGEYY